MLLCKHAKVDKQAVLYNTDAMKTRSVLMSIFLAVVVLFSISLCPSVTAHQELKSIQSRPNILRDIDSSVLSEKITTMLTNTINNATANLKGLSFQTNTSSLRLGLISTLILTILSEFYIYVTFFTEYYGSLQLGTIAALLLLSIIINSITNPAMNIIYLFYKDIAVLEYVVTVIESFMIFISFNLLIVTMSFEDARDLSERANSYSYLFCKWVNSILGGSTA